MDQDLVFLGCPPIVGGHRMRPIFGSGIWTPNWDPAAFGCCDMKGWHVFIKPMSGFENRSLVGAQSCCPKFGLAWLSIQIPGLQSVFRAWAAHQILRFVCSEFRGISKNTWESISKCILSGCSKGAHKPTARGNLLPASGTAGEHF